MATTTTRWGNTPLTTEGLATLGHPLSLDDFNHDAGGYWRNIRGQKTYYPREWFDDTGTFTGTGTQEGDRAGQDKGFFHQGVKWNWETGQWENPTNWANVIGLSAAGVVGAGIAAPLIAGGAGATAGGYGPLAGGYGGATTTATVPSSLAAVGGGGTVASMLTPTAGDLIRGGTDIFGRLISSGASKDATDAQAAASKYAADLNAKAQADQLAFLRQQAGYDASVAESTRSGNYDQWAARQEMLGPVGQALGLPARRIPAYVPLPANPYLTGSPAPTPTGTGGGTGTTGGTGGTTTTTPPASGAGVSASNGDIRTQVANYYKARGVTPNPTSVDYWAQKWNEFGAKDPAYFNQRLAIADEFGGGGAPAPAAAAPRVQPMSSDPLSSVNDYLDAAYDTGRLQMPSVRPYYAGAVGSYLA